MACKGPISATGGAPKNAQGLTHIIATSGHNTIPQIAQHLDCVIVPPEANSAGKLRGDFEAMAKRRFQSPEPERSGNWWYLRYWTDAFENGKLVRKRVRHKLAAANKGEREVKKMAAEFLRPMNHGLESIGSATLFSN